MGDYNLSFDLLPFIKHGLVSTTGTTIILTRRIYISGIAI